MKPLTLSNDQAKSIYFALTARIKYLERLLADLTTDGGNASPDLILVRDELDVARQARDATESSTGVANSANKRVVCKDCRHFDDQTKDGARCNAPSVKASADPVYGRSPTCYFARRNYPCGPEGKLFDARAPQSVGDLVQPSRNTI